MKLGSSLSTSASRKAKQSFQITTLQADQNNVHANHTTARSPAALKASGLNTLRTNNERFRSRLAVVISIVYYVHFQLASTSLFISPAAVESPHIECDQFSGLLRYIASQFGRLDDDFTILLPSARDSRSSAFRGVSSLIEAFGAPLT